MTNHEREVMRTDRRWLLVYATLFLASLSVLWAAYGIYRLTGPHPQVRLFIREVVHEARWLIPFNKWQGHIPRRSD